MNLNQHIKSASDETLKQEYLACLASVSSTAVTLKRVVNELIDLGLTRQNLLQWAVDRGYNKPHVQSLLSKLLCQRGWRQRRPGAGRKPNPDALAILASVGSEYGHDRARRLLRAALRLSAAELPTASPTPTPALDPLIVEQQLTPETKLGFNVVNDDYSFPPP